MESLFLLWFNSIISFINSESDFVIFDCDDDGRINSLAELTLRSFYRHYIILQGNCYTCRDVNRQFTYSRHFVPPKLINIAKNFTTNLKISSSFVVGDGKGVIGYGLGKAGEVTAAIAKGVEAAKKNLVKVPVLKGTVPHEQSARFGGAEVLILPASEGTGVVAGGAMRAVLESVGIKNVLAKSKGSSNPHNLVKATILALSEMRDARTVAQHRGVSLEKVFRG